MVDWVSRQGNLKRHKHFQADIIDPTTAEAAVLGAEQTVRLLGPYNVTYQTAGITTTGVQLAELEAGQLLIGAWAVNQTTWSPAAPTTVSHVLFIGGLPANQAPGEAWDDGYYLEVNRQQAEFSNGLGIVPEPSKIASPTFVNAVTTPDTLQQTPALILTAAVLGIIVETTEALSSGESDIYALIAESA